MTPTPRIEDYMQTCKRCKEHKHLSEYPSSVQHQRLCKECNRKSCIASRLKTGVKNTSYSHNYFNKPVKSTTKN